MTRTLGARRTHRYEDPATGQVYVIPAGETRELPDAVAVALVTAHPDKLFYADRADHEAHPNAGANRDRMVEPPARPVEGRTRRPRTHRA